MTFVRRSRRTEIFILGAIVILLIWNLIYFKRIELKLDSASYLSKISMGSSDRDENNEFVWSSPTLPSDKGDEHVIFGPETLEQLINSSIPREEENLTAKRKREQLLPIDYFTTTTPPPTDTIEASPLNTNKDDDSQNQKSNNHCPENPPNLTGKVELDTSEELIDDVQEKLKEILYPGGHYTPSKCQARHRVAIIVPYRNRSKDLAIFLKNIHPFLIKQQLEYGVFVIEQAVGTKFNRAMLLNVGYLEAKKIKNWDCFIFHDVDLLPMDDRNLYTCSKNPRHLAVAVDKFDNRLPSYNTINGVLAVTSEQFEKMNGYSNLFWGWGCEDLDLANRLKNANYKIDRYDEEIARYTMLSSDPVEPNVKRLDLLREGPTKFKTIGLNSIKYTVQCIDESPAYTWIFVTLKPEVPGDESNVEQLGVK